MLALSKRHDEIAEYIAAFFCGMAKATTDRDTNTDVQVVILTSRDCPEIGISSYSTLGLSDKNLVIDGRDFGFGVKVCGAIITEQDKFLLILADIGFNVVEEKWVAAHHTVFPNVVEPYFPDSEMKHVLLVSPFLWDEDFGDYSFADQRVVWLLAVPISENEYRYALSVGADCLEDMFAQKQINLFNIYRDSVL